MAGFARKLPKLQLSLVAVMAAVGLGGCATSPIPTDPPGPDATESSTIGPDSTPVSRPTCVLVPNTLIESTLDIQVPAAQESTSDAVTTCTYLGATTVIVRLSTDEDATSFGQARRHFDDSGQPTTDVTGLGDQAYYSSVEFGDSVTNTLVARQGPVAVQVAAVASVDAEKNLIGKIFTALH